jgi:hypothetical protein
MTERLSQLLHDEATGLDLPAPDPHRILSDGRRLRRRRRVTAGLAAAAVVAVLAGAGVAAIQAGGADRGEPAPAGDVPSPVVYGVGSRIALDDDVATVPDTVHSLHYTSEGVLVRSNPRGGASDGSGPESLTLVRWDGSTTDLGTIPEGVGPATDPEEPVYVLAEARGDGFAAVVRDAETGEQVEEVPLPDLPPSYWEVPPLALDGNTLYVGYKKSTAAVDLGTGEHRIVDGMAGGLPEVQGHHAFTRAGRSGLTVLDTITGEDVLRVETEEYAWGTLSPDGRYLRIESEGALEGGTFVEPDSIDVYDVVKGTSVEIAGDPYGWGWTPGGELFRIAAGTVTTCDPGTGECAEAPAPLPGKGEVRVGGRLYES